jgi:glycosyltransferase involved in cell wall biosynthesis
MAINISIIICTRDRAESLRPTLESIGRTKVPAGWSVELVVVDNGSSDHTHAVVSEARLNNVVLRYLKESTRGQCRARNKGLRETTGQIILFTDDDVRTSQNWIEGMCRPILEGRADAVQGGIKIAPHLDRPWLTGSLRVWVASVEDPARPPAGLVGANMAFGRRMIEIAGEFDQRLGPGAAGFFDDTLFGWALEKAGRKILYQPFVTVEHHFAPDRLLLRSYINSAHRMAASYAIVKRDLDPTAFRPSVFALIRQLPGLGVRCVTQAGRYIINRQPDPGFVMRYYEFLLWRALRKLS